MKDILAKLAALEGSESTKKNLNESFEPGMDEAKRKELPPSVVYPDTKDGVIQFMNDPNEVNRGLVKKLNLPECNIHPDPSVEGVWAIDSPDGTRVIVYLGGYKDPWGQIRPYNDFEVGTRKKSNAYEDIDEAKNHLGEREYETYNGWKRACRKAYPGCTFYGDRDIGGANLNGKDVGEWDGSVGCVYNGSMSGIPVSEAKAPSLASRIKNAVYADQISKDKSGNYIFRKGYFYRNGMDSDKWAARVSAELAKAGIDATLVNSYDHWAAFKGGASVKNQSHWAAVFSIPDQSAALPVAESEVIDEISGSTLGSYVQKARADRAAKIDHSKELDADDKVVGLRDKIRGWYGSKQYKKDGSSIHRSKIDKAYANIEARKKKIDPDYPKSTDASKRNRGINKAIEKLNYGNLTDSVVEDRDEEPRLAFGQRDWEMDAEMNPRDPYLDYRANGGKLTRREWEFDQTQGVGESVVSEAGPVRDPLALAVKKIATDVLGQPYSTARIAGGTVYRISIPMRGFKHPLEYHSGVALADILPSDKQLLQKRRAKLLAAVEQAGLDVSKVDVKFHMGSGIYASVRVKLQPTNVAESKKPKNLDDAIRKYGHEHPKTIKAAEREEKKAAKKDKKIAESKSVSIVLEGVKFRVSDPKVAKVLRRFPHEAQNFDAGSELDDRLFDALYDHYLANGEMPYGVAKARDGDPYEWVSNKLQTEMSSGNNVFSEGVGSSDPEIEEIFAKYPHEAKIYRETGELEDGPLYEELFDHYCNNGEMPYGVAKARDGDPVQWISDRLSVDLGESLSESDGEEDIELDEALTSAQQERLARMKAQDAEWAAAKARIEDGRPKVNPFANDTRGRTGDELAWRSQQGNIAFHEDSFDPTPSDADDEVLVEQSHEVIVAKLSDLGFDEGLDFFFDGDDLVVIGRSTARAVINAVGGHIISIDGEEVRISNKPKAKVVPSNTEVADLSAEPEMFESVDLKKANLGDSGTLATQLGKLARVIKSVKTLDQLESAKRMADNVKRIYEKDAISKKSFGAGLKDVLKTFNAIDADIKTKRREIEGSAVTENVQLSIAADGEEDVLSVIRKLSGMGPNATVTPAPIGIPTALATIDAIQADDYASPESEFDLGEFDDVDDSIESEVEECYANTPEPEEQLGLSASIANAGNEPGRRAYTAGNAVTESKIVRQYTKGNK